MAQLKFFFNGEIRVSLDVKMRQIVLGIKSVSANHCRAHFLSVSTVMCFISFFSFLQNVWACFVLGICDKQK